MEEKENIGINPMSFQVCDGGSLWDIAAPGIFGKEIADKTN